MSFSLPPVSLSGAVIGTSGTVDWTSLAQSAGYGVPTSVPYLALLNESPSGLQLQFSTGEQMSLPAGGWQTIALNANCTSFTYKVLYVLNASPIVASLLGTWYAPGESVPDAPILGNSPIGGSITTGNLIAQFLQGVNQAISLTEVDNAGVASLAPGSGTANAGIDFMVNDAGGNRLIVFTIDNSSGIGSLNISSPIVTGTASRFTQYHGDTTLGNGVPAIVALAENIAVSSTALTPILTYTTLNDGANHSLRVNAWVDVNNGTSGNNLSLQVVYTDPRTGIASTTPFSTATSTAAVSFNGSTSITNSRYAMYPYMIYCKPNTTVTIQYRDPTNTPSDHVSAFIERIS